MSNVLDKQKQQDVIALGRLGWSLRQIERRTGVRRETVADYLRAAGIPVRGRGRRSEARAKPAISSAEVSTDLPAKPAIDSGVSTDPSPARAPSASACEIYREVITEALARGRNAMAIWQDLVDDHGFTARYASVRRFVRRAAAFEVGHPRLCGQFCIGSCIGGSPSGTDVGRPILGGDDPSD